jgi:tetratricopeptide (TPR) repeat protein
MSVHVFVAMPFGVKEGIDFNRVYSDLIKPALEGAGFDVFRADEETAAGNIRTDMFQELLIADLVVADVSINNPNVWYELGVRHALRARGVIQIASDLRKGMPFDVYTDRTLHYHTKGAGLDPEKLDADRKALGEMAKATMARWQGYKISPVYHLLPEMREPNWRELLITGDNEFRDSLNRWQQRVEVARQKNRAGDVLVLADETPTWVLHLEAKRLAGKALVKMGQFGLALSQYEAALSMDSDDREANQQKGVLLGRLGKHEEAREHIKSLLEKNPRDVETLALLGRVEKDEWISRWRQAGNTQAAMKEQAAAEDALLLEAIEPYMKAFTMDPTHFYSGINAVTLRHLYAHLGGQSGDPETLPDLEGGVLWSCLSALERSPKDYWARASFAELTLLLAPVDKVTREYRNAVAAANRDWFALDSSRQQLLLLGDLGFRPEQVAAALEVLEKEISRATPPYQPRQVFLFSGHMIDKPGKQRFPPDMESIAAEAIAAKVKDLGGGMDDVAICGGACGGDTLFAEACLKSGMKLQIHIQYPEPEFLAASVSFAGQQWVDRYFALKEHATVLVQPEELGDPPKETNVYVRNNLWQLYTALSFGPDRVRFISLWDGKEGEGPGGTKHMVETVQKYSGRAVILYTTDLWKVS